MTDEAASLEAFIRRLYRPYQAPPHVRDLVAALERAVATPNARLIVTMPPRHSKSLHVSEHLPAWYLGTHENRRIIGASNIQKLANKFSRRARNKFTHPAWPFPAVRVAGDKSAVERWDIAGAEGGYVAVGVGATPTGEGADLMLIDDPIRSQADADSETVRDALWEWYTETMYPRLEPGGTIIVCATRWHEDDLTGRLLDAKRKGGEHWDELHMPAISDDGAALWPERWPLDALDRIRSTIGSRAFEAQYQGRPVPAEGGTFKRQWWRTYEELPYLDRVEIAVDSAFKTGTANDWSVFAAWGGDALGRAYLLRVWRQRVEFPDLIRLGRQAISWAANRFPDVAPILVVEDQASGQSAVQQWRSEGVTVTPYPVAGQGSKQARAEAVTPFVEGGRAFIPEDAEWLDDWLIEHDRFPSGKHDDQVDTTVMGVTRICGTGQDWPAEADVGGWLRAGGIG